MDRGRQCCWFVGKGWPVRPPPQAKPCTSTVSGANMTQRDTWLAPLNVIISDATSISSPGRTSTTAHRSMPDWAAESMTASASVDAVTKSSFQRSRRQSKPFTPGKNQVRGRRSCHLSAIYPVLKTISTGATSAISRFCFPPEDFMPIVPLYVAYSPATNAGD